MYGAIKILAGDFKIGRGSTYALGKLYLRKNGSLFREEVPVADIASLEIADSNVGSAEQNALAGGVVGGAMFGGAGMVAGSVIGSNSKEVAAVCVLKDGRKWLGMMATTDYNKLKQKVMSLTYFKSDSDEKGVIAAESGTSEKNMGSKQKKPKPALKTFGCLFAVSSFIFFFFVLFMTMDPPKPWDKVENTISAETRMQTYVKDNHLRFPDGAKFFEFSEPPAHVEHLGDQVYEVYAWVKAKNAFGVYIKYNYYGKIKQVDDGVWEVLEFNFL